MSERASVRAALGWAGLAVAGQAAAVSLINAGHSIGYQHYLPISQLPSRPLPLALLGAQALLVLWALRSQFGTLIERARSVLPGWRLPALVLATGISAATVGRDIPRYVGESVLSCLVQLISLCTIILAVRAIPSANVSSLTRGFDRLLGQDIPSGDDVRPRLDRFAIVTAIVVTIVCAVLSIVVYARHPHIQDEVAYLFQARTFALGRIALPSPPAARAFEQYLIADGPTGWYSPVPPGWAAALAPGVLAGAPWLVNPVLAGVNILLGYLVLQPLYGRRVARLTTLLLAVSPWNLFLGMSYMPHTFTLFCALVATLSVITTRRTGHARWTWLGGAALGILAAARQLDAGIMAAALGLWCIGLGGRRLRVTGTAGLVLGSMLLTVPLLAYNQHFTGKASSFPMMTYNDALYGKGANDYGFGKNRGMGWALDPNPGHGPVDGTINGTLNITATQVELFGWSIGSLLLVYAFVFGGRLNRSDRLMLGVMVITFTAYFFNYFAGGPDFGARYWFLMIVPLAALTARGALWLGPLVGTSASDSETRVFSGLALLTLSAGLVFMPWRSVDKYWHYRGMRPDLRVLQAQAGFGKGLILVSGREIPDYASAATYNPLDLHESVPIYARNREAASDSAVIAAFPERPVWFVDGPSVSGDGYVVRAGPLSAADALQRIASEPNPPVTGAAASRQ
ncbi:MAG: hypothetical protein ABI625_15120 [bacterium]